MTPEQLAVECARVHKLGLSRIQLVIPAEPRGERIRLDRTSRRKCPMGEVLCVKDVDGHPETVAVFDAFEVLAWLVAILSRSGR